MMIPTILIFIASMSLPEPPTAALKVTASDPEWIVITPEMQLVLDRDPVFQFMRRVGDAAVKDPEWNKCYPCAEYRAAVDEATRHYIQLLKSKGMIR